MPKTLSYIAMGSNLGDRGETLMQAVKMLSEVPGVTIRRLSQFVRTLPVGGPEDQPVYLNAAVEADVALAPRELLETLQAIERALGRDRAAERRWGPRTCDLDILLMGDAVVHEPPELIIPHPRMHERAFVLEPMMEIAPDAVHPERGKTVAEMLDDVRGGRVGPAEDPESVDDADAARDADEGPAPLISVIGLPASGKTTLAELLAMELPARLVREDYEGNPFLAQSYAGSADARLPAQLFYLLSRVHQLSSENWPAGGTMISDYGFCQDRVYASLRLVPHDLAVYEPLLARLAPRVVPPSVMVHLDAEPAVLLERIAQRGRSFEKAMTREFLSDMRRAYEGVVEAASCPVVTVRCDEVDLRNYQPRAELAERIRAEL